MGTWLSEQTALWEILAFGHCTNKLEPQTKVRRPQTKVRRPQTKVRLKPRHNKVPASSDHRADDATDAIPVISCSNLDRSPFFNFFLCVSVYYELKQSILTRIDHYDSLAYLKSKGYYTPAEANMNFISDRVLRT